MLKNECNAPSDTVKVEPYEKILNELKTLWGQDEHGTVWKRDSISSAISNLETFIKANK